MKKIALLLVIWMFLSCQNSSNVKINESTLIQDYKGYKESKYQSAFKIYEDNNKRFFILQDEKRVYENLKFVKVLDLNLLPPHEYAFQILDEENNFKKIILHSDVRHVPQYACGTAMIMSSSRYEFTAMKKANGFSIGISRSKGFSQGMEKELTIFKNNEFSVDEILFPNLKNVYRVRSDDAVSALFFVVLFKKNNKYGIAGKIKVSKKMKKVSYAFERSTNLFTYDNVSLVNAELLIEKDALLGYYGISEIKYSSLEPFVNGLARFRLVNGKSGYLDREGKEYYD